MGTGLQIKLPIAWAAHPQVKFAGYGQHGVANAFGVQSGAVHSPQELVVGIQSHRCGARPAG